MRGLLARFRKSGDGIAAVEFALILPLLVTLFFGVTEISMALSCRADVANVAATAADLVAQESTVTTPDMTNVFAASSAILYPNAVGNATITVYSILDSTNTSSSNTGSKSTGKVAWSCTKAGTANATPGPTTPPTGSTGGDMIAATNLDASGTPTYGGIGSVILATISYKYTSWITRFLPNQFTMTNTFYVKPRRVTTITAPPSCS